MQAAVEQAHDVDATPFRAMGVRQQNQVPPQEIRPQAVDVPDPADLVDDRGLFENLARLDLARADAIDGLAGDPAFQGFLQTNFGIDAPSLRRDGRREEAAGHQQIKARMIFSFADR